MSLVDGFFVLPADVKIRKPSQADGLPPGLGSGEFLISRPGGRVHPLLIPETAATFLEFLREPTLFETAIIRYCDVHGGHPPDVLSSLVPLLCDLVNKAYLVSPEAAAARSVDPSLSPGRQVGEFDIVRCVRASVDTEVYLARHRNSGQLAALKIESSEQFPGAAAAISRESEVLAELDGEISPRLLARGEFDGASYLLAEWLEGRCPEELAAASRYRHDTETRRNSLHACCQILEAYTQLHAAGFLHGDVQPFNIVLPEQGPARLIDFGQALWTAEEEDREAATHGRADPFIEPEVAAATLRGEPPPPTSAMGEQYLIAAVLYRVLTGSDHLELSVIEEQLLRRIAAGKTRPFSHVGHTPWPEVENPLTRALRKDPSSRFEQVADLRHAFEVARLKFPRRRKNDFDPRFKEVADTIAERYSELIRTQEGWMVPSNGLSEGFDPDLGVHPHSLAYGAGGVALGLLQMARLRADPTLLASADIWLTRALRACGGLSEQDSDHEPHELTGDSSPPNLAINVPEQTVLPTTAGADGISLYLGAPGLHFADALVASSSGDLQRMLKATDRFLVASSEPADRLELFGGRAGTLLGLSLIQRSASEQFGAEIADLRRSGDQLFQSILEQLDRSGRVGASGPANLGIAHGSAGILYSAMHWLGSSQPTLPDPIRDHLEGLAAHGVKWGDSLRWPWFTSDESGDVEVLFTSGWCNGSAGFMHLWLLAYELSPDPRYLERAKASARGLGSNGEHPAHLCCGAAGMVYSLLRLLQVTQEEVWLAGAHRLMRNSIARLSGGLERNNRASLFRGEVGVAVAALDITAPDDARMPTFV